MGKHSRPIEAPGTVFVVSAQNQYIVEEVLGAGGFGEVYKVSLQRDRSKKYAMKTERVDLPPIYQRLKIECHLLEILHVMPGNRDHFIKMTDAGVTDKNRFLIMEMVSYSLNDIYNRMMKRKFGLYTAIEVGLQSLKAIEALHDHGWLHRDVKPGNFSIGLPPHDQKLFLLDFGTARKYRDVQGRLRVPRVSVKTPKTLTYCSLRGHMDQEQCRRDDLEMWLFMTLEFLNPANYAAIRTSRNVDEIYQGKKAILERPRELYKEGRLLVPHQFLTVIERINWMRFTDPGDYNGIRADFDNIIKAENIDIYHTPLDWIGRKMPEKTKPVQEPAKEAKKLTEEEKADAKLAEMLFENYKKDGIIKTEEQLKIEVAQWKKFKEEQKKMLEESSSEESTESSKSEDSRRGETMKSRRRSKRSRRDHKRSSRSDRSGYSKRSRGEGNKKKSRNESRKAENEKNEAKIATSNEHTHKSAASNGKCEKTAENPQEVTCKEDTVKSLQKIAGKCDRKDSNQELTCKTDTVKSGREKTGERKDPNTNEKTCNSESSQHCSKSAQGVKSSLSRLLFWKKSDKKPDEASKKDPGPKKF